MNDFPEHPSPPPLSVRGVWWCRGWLRWYARDRWVLKREGWHKDGRWGWVAPDG